MAKKAKDTTASSAKKEAKAKAPADPIATKNLIRLLNILALLLVITAFVLQLFAVIAGRWKWQKTDLRSLLKLNGRSYPVDIQEGALLEQNYGLFSRDVKVYANEDEKIDITASTRFPRLGKGEHAALHACLAEQSTYQSALLACSGQVRSGNVCNCRRYPHWNAIIFFEIAGLILLGLAVFVSALLSTQFGRLLKLVGAGLSFLAFLFLLIGLILLLSYLKRETHTVADTFPHISTQIANQVRRPIVSAAHKIVARETQQTYRAYSLSPGQYPFNDTHFQQYSEQARAWVQIPYTQLQAVQYAPQPKQAAAAQSTTPAPVLFNEYGPLAGYDEVFDRTRASISCSGALSILAMILALLVPLLLAFSFLKGQQLGPEVKTVTTTTVRTEYVAIPQDSTAETAPLTKSAPIEEVRQEQIIVHEHA